MNGPYMNVAKVVNTVCIKWNDNKTESVNMSRLFVNAFASSCCVITWLVCMSIIWIQLRADMVVPVSTQKKTNHRVPLRTCVSNYCAVCAHVVSWKEWIEVMYKPKYFLENTCLWQTRKCAYSSAAWIDCMNGVMEKACEHTEHTCLVCCLMNLIQRENPQMVFAIAQVLECFIYFIEFSLPVLNKVFPLLIWSWAKTESHVCFI